MVDIKRSLPTVYVTSRDWEREVPENYSNGIENFLPNDHEKIELTTTKGFEEMRGRILGEDPHMIPGPLRSSYGDEIYHTPNGDIVILKDLVRRNFEAHPYRIMIVYQKPQSIPS